MIYWLIKVYEDDISNSNALNLLSWNITWTNLCVRFWRTTIDHLRIDLIEIKNHGPFISNYHATHFSHSTLHFVIFSKYKKVQSQGQLHKNSLLLFLDIDLRNFNTRLFSSSVIQLMNGKCTKGPTAPNNFACCKIFKAKNSIVAMISAYTKLQFFFRFSLRSFQQYFYLFSLTVERPTQPNVCSGFNIFQ